MLKNVRSIELISSLQDQQDCTVKRLTHCSCIPVHRSAIIGGIFSLLSDASNHSHDGQRYHTATGQDSDTEASPLSLSRLLPVKQTDDDDDDDEPVAVRDARVRPATGDR